MRALAEMLRRLGALLRRTRLEDRLDEEMRFHVEQQIEKNRQAGMSAREARRQALIRFGGVEQMRERTRDEFGAARIETLARDIRYGVRSLRRHPGFTAMAVLSLAIGIGANATILGVAYAVLFKQSPLSHPETLVNIYETEGTSTPNPLSHPNIEDLRKGTAQIFSGIAASTFAARQIDRGGTQAAIMGEAVTGGAFALLGVTPAIGRAIQAEDDAARGGHPVVMLSYGYWQRAFGGDPEIVGRPLIIGGRNYTIIGVAPPDYRGGLPAVTPAFYVPMSMLDEVMGFESLDQRDFHNFFARARLAPGVTRPEAEHAASLVAASLTAARPEGWVSGEGFVLVPTSDVQVVPGIDPLLRAATVLLIVVVGAGLWYAVNRGWFALADHARITDKTKEAGQDDMAGMDMPGMKMGDMAKAESKQKSEVAGYAPIMIAPDIQQRIGVTINRRDLVAAPVPRAHLLWHDLHVRRTASAAGQQRTEHVLIEIEVSGVTRGEMWSCGLEFDYENPESFYCRPAGAKRRCGRKRRPASWSA